MIQEYMEGNVVWTASLSNGEEVIRYDVHEDSWKALLDRCKSENLSITGLYLRYRSNTVSLPSNQLGYMFCKGIIANTQKTYDMYSIGYLTWDNAVVVRQYVVPTLQLFHEETREKYECPTLYINPHTEQPD